MPTIRQLPPSLINKIAAGEVIERPASVVKELLENSIDAGSTRVELLVEKGGLELVRVSDNGCGISAEQLPLAIASHATSKLVTADDLFDIHTLGFRGEALASIAEVSHLEMRSRTPDSEMGAMISVRGGEMTGPDPIGCPVGTVISMRHLFFNTPVRLKFLRSAQTEMGHVVEAFTRIALAYPQTHLVLISNDRTLYDLPPTDRWSERIRPFFGDEVADNLIHVESQIDEIKLRGFVTDPCVSRSNNRMQYLFLNGRFIRDRSLQHSLSEAYRGLLMVGRYPVCFLRLDMPANQVDVNVHPTKMEVRFQDGGRLYSQVLQTLRHQFLSTDMTARVQASRVPTAGVPASTSDSTTFPGASPSRDSWQSHEDQVRQWARGESPTGPQTQRLPLTTTPEFQPFPTTGPRAFPSLASRPSTPSFSSERSFSNDRAASSVESHNYLPPGAQPWDAQTTLDASERPEASVDAYNQWVAGSTGQADSAASHRENEESQFANRRFDAPATQPSASHLGFQVHQRYLVTEDEHGMVVIDQHALHERILYEQVREKVLDGKLEVQRLLVPEPVSLTPAEAAIALDSQELLGKVGIQVEPFGGDTVLITAYPAMLANLRPSELLHQVLETIMGSAKEPDVRDLLDHLLHTIACKAAIKAGDRLSSEEITALLTQRHHFHDTHHCPHGRPTALFFSREQLDKMFKRT